jgi:uncharacterized protein
MTLGYKQSGRAMSKLAKRTSVATTQIIDAWVLSDGKAGDESQCIGVVEALGLVPQVRKVMPRAPFTWAMPYGPIDPRESALRSHSPIKPPFPTLLVASGRRAIAYVRAVKRASQGQTFTVILKDPRTGAGAADLIWVAEHDRLRGNNVLVTLTAPHRISRARLAEARAYPDPRLASLRAVRVAVLLGGDSRHHHFQPADIDRLVEDLRKLTMSGASLMVTASRRTPPDLARRAGDLARTSGGFFWDGTGDNPYLAMLALADSIVVTADSTNMVGEAAATGRPVLVFEPSGGHSKISSFLAGLKRRGVVHIFAGALVGEPYQPLNATSIIAEAIASQLRMRGIII